LGAPTGQRLDDTAISPAGVKALGGVFRYVLQSGLASPLVNWSILPGSESADVLYHLLTLWASVGVKPQDVWTELNRREGLSGNAEKAARKRE
jgi:hypothetical protein